MKEEVYRKTNIKEVEIFWILCAWNWTLTIIVKGIIIIGQMNKKQSKSIKLIIRCYTKNILNRLSKVDYFRNISRQNKTKKNKNKIPFQSIKIILLCIINIIIFLFSQEEKRNLIKFKSIHISQLIMLIGLLIHWSISLIRLKFHTEVFQSKFLRPQVISSQLALWSWWLMRCLNIHLTFCIFFKPLIRYGELRFNDTLNWQKFVHFFRVVQFESIEIKTYLIIHLFVHIFTLKDS